jgi:hypothetical protein
MIGTAGFKRTAAAAAFVGVSMLLASSHTSAGIEPITLSSFNLVASPGQITFSEFPLGTVNPTYLPATYGGGASSPTVTFDGFFAGQSLGTLATCPLLTAPFLPGCVIGSPTNPLSLNAAAPNTQIINDPNFLTPPVLSGSTGNIGPIAMLLSKDVTGIGFDAGSFENASSTKVTAYARNGAELGSLTINFFDVHFFGLQTNDATGIAGLLFSLVQDEPFGYAIDNVRFIVPSAVVTVPEPASLALLVVGLLGFALRRRRNV